MLPCPGEGGEKYRILVDKTYCQEIEGNSRAEEYYPRISALGFNVICPRFQLNDRYITDITSVPGGLGEEERGDIRRQATLAQRSGMYFMGWLRGSSRTKDSANRYTLASGWEFGACSPNSDELWDAFGETVLDYARLSQELPVLGVLLDFELYARPLPPAWPGHLYGISYDDRILREFAEARGLDYPGLAPKGRAGWLEAQGAADSFIEFQKESWRQRMRALRERVDAINPRFKFGCYPSHYTLFAQEAVWKELGTERAPLLVLEHYTYGRGFPKKDRVSGYWRVSDEKGARLNADFLMNKKRYYDTLGSHYELLGGLDPTVCGGEDPQFAAMSMLAMSEVADGYWVFFEGVVPRSPQARAFDGWFELANELISTQVFDLGVLLSPPDSAD